MDHRGASMGMFDYIQAQCPDCNALIEEQTKDGPCDMLTYTIKPIMKARAALIVDGTILYCEKCDIDWQVKAKLEEIEVTIEKY